MFIFVIIYRGLVPEIEYILDIIIPKITRNRIEKKPRENGKAEIDLGRARVGWKARAGGAWVGEAPGGCQWSDACRVLARRSRGYARPAEWSFFGVLGGYPRSCAPPRLYSQRWLNGGSLRCACSCPLTELPCVLLQWHALCLAG